MSLQMPHLNTPLLAEPSLGRTMRRLVILALLAAGYAGAVGFVLLVSDGVTALRNHMSGIELASV